MCAYQRNRHKRHLGMDGHEGRAAFERLQVPVDGSASFWKDK